MIITNIKFLRDSFYENLNYLSHRNNSRGHSKRATPVPVPNTVVKPLRADGTRTVCPGRVGRL